MGGKLGNRECEAALVEGDRTALPSLSRKCLMTWAQAQRAGKDLTVEKSTGWASTVRGDVTRTG
mgnify:FL=1